MPEGAGRPDVDERTYNVAPRSEKGRRVASPWRRIRVILGDITAVPTDAIVNAANASLAGGGGVDGAIHRAGGPSIMAELQQRYDGCPTGGAVVTSAGDLPARWVIHAVGPRWRGGGHGERELLESAYREALSRAHELGASRMTFPAISCGIYGYPLKAGARIALETVEAHLQGATSLEEVTFVLRGAETLKVFGHELEALGRRRADAES